MLAPFLIPNLLQEVDIFFSPAKFLVWTVTQLLPAKKRLVSQPDIVHLVHLLLAGHYHPCCLWNTKRPFLHIYAIFYGIRDATSAFILWRGTKMIFGTKDWYRESRDGIPHYQSPTIQLCPGAGEDLEEWEGRRRCESQRSVSSPAFCFTYFLVAGPSHFTNLEGICSHLQNAPLFAARRGGLVCGCRVVWVGVTLMLIWPL